MNQILGDNGKPGEGVPDYGPIPPNVPYYVPFAASTSLQLASETLGNAGWNMGQDGFRSKTVQKSTIPLVINLTVPQIDFLVKTAEALQSDWQNIGVSTTIATIHRKRSAQTASRTAATNRSCSAIS